MLQECIDKLAAAYEQHENKGGWFRNGPLPIWWEYLVQPLADWLVEQYNGQHTVNVTGPFGLGARVYITLHPTDVPEGRRFGIEYWRRVDVASIGFELDNWEGLNGLLWVDESRSTGEYAPGTIGYVNGFNHPRLPVTSFEQVKEILDAKMEAKHVAAQ